MNEDGNFLCRLHGKMKSLLSPALRAQIKKEFLSILRDKKTRIVVIVPPILQLFIFAFAVTLEVNNAKIAVYNRDTGVEAGRFIAELAHASFVGELHVVGSEEALREAINLRKSLLAVVFPPDFSRKINGGEQGDLLVITDGRRANSAQVAAGYIAEIASTFGQINYAERKVPNPGVVRHWFNENLIYQWFVVPGLSGIISLLIAFILTALSIARERELGTFDQLLVSPCSSWEIIAAKMAPSLVLGMFLSNVIVVAGVFIFRVPFLGSFWLLEISLLVFILAVASIGLTVSAISNTQQQAVLGSFAIIVPLILCSGFATPVANMPPVLQYFAQAIPLTHYIIIVEGIFMKAMPASIVWNHIGAMALIGLICLTGSSILVRRKLQ